MQQIKQVQLVINDSNMVVKTSASVNGVSVDTKRTDIDDTSYIAEFMNLN
ncbi:hypothetical protein [Clostridium butyricum]|nr:hypothetical protein [Clostridium butyricum]